MRRQFSTLHAAILCFGIGLLYVPILVLIGYSFNASPLVNVWGGFSTVWYARLLHHQNLLDSALLSLEVALCAASIAVVLGTLAALALVRFARFPGRFLLSAMVTAPLVMPEVITGIALLLLFVSLLHTFSWPQRGFFTIVVAHATFCIAYVTVTVQSRLHGADRSLEEAAMDLGAGPAGAFIDVTLPLIAPAIVSGWLLSFTLSLDDLVSSSFMAGPSTNTLPMLIYSKVKLGLSPVINALATLIIAAVGAGVLCAGWLMRRAEARHELEMREAERLNAAPRVPDAGEQLPRAVRSPS